MDGHEESRILEARMLGGFSVRFQGKEIVDSRQNAAQFGRLLQMLLFFHKDGVERQTLKEYLFEDREIEDAQHALRNVIYNARRRLTELGLPDVAYTAFRNNRYFWTEEIPVSLDTDRMESLIREAQNETDQDRKLMLLLEAARLYRGEFLSGLSGAGWISYQAHRYQLLYRECLDSTFEILREKQDFRRMKTLSEQASAVDPFAEWEVRQVEALVALGKYEEAQKLCDRTVDRYIEEHGQRTSAYMRELVNRLNAEMIHQHEDLSEIQSKLMEPVTAERGGYFCSYPVFQEVYRTVARMMERHGDMVFLMLCTVMDSKGNPMKEGPRLDELSERLLEAIIRSVRRSDTVTKYGKGQYLVLLANTTSENCSIVQRRISQNFVVGRQRTSVEYFISSVVTDKLKIAGTGS